MNLDVDLGIESLFELINKQFYNYIDIGRKTREDPVDVRKPGVSDFRKKFFWLYIQLLRGAYAYEKQSNKGAADDGDGCRIDAGDAGVCG